MEFTTCFELQSQTTRLVDTRSKNQTYGSLTLSAALFQGTWSGFIMQVSIDHNSTNKFVDSQNELFPLHSPLLGESWLVSFPPLINMLKFSGSSCLSWDQQLWFMDWNNDTTVFFWSTLTLILFLVFLQETMRQFSPTVFVNRHYENVAQGFFSSASSS